MPDASQRRSLSLSGAGFLVAATLLPASFSQVAMGQEAQPAEATKADKRERGEAAAGRAEATKARANPQDAVRAALIQNAIVASTRRSDLILRDLTVRCGVPKADVEKLGEALNQGIGAWVEAHPPPESGVYEPDFFAILQGPTVIDAFEKTVPPEALRAFRDLREARRRRLVAATARVVWAYAACELRVSRTQYKALVPLCNEIARQAVETGVVSAQPSQLVAAWDRGSVRVLSEIQSEYAASPTRGLGRDAVVEFDLESDRIRLVCALDDERAKLLRACARSQGRKQIAAQKAAIAAAERNIVEAKTPEDARRAMEVLESRPRPDGIGLPREEVLKAPFWIKVCDSVLTAEERAKLAAAPPIAAGVVRDARVELALARLDFLFHLDSKQADALRPLAELVVAKDLESMLVAPLDVFRSFGMHAGNKPPGQRAARRSLEDLLDPLQFEVLRDTVGL